MQRTLILGPAVLLAGSLVGGSPSSQPVPPPAVAAAAYVPHSITLADPAELAAAQVAPLLEKIQAKYERPQWLTGTVWQRSHDSAFPYEAQSTLTRGPNFCVRVETVLRDVPHMKRLIVCDGRLLAVALYSPSTANDQVERRKVPTSEGDAACEKFLADHGGRGPVVAIRELRDVLLEPTVTAGTWQHRKIVRIRGKVAHTHTSLHRKDPYRGHPARSVEIYVDVQSDELLRVEWRSADGTMVLEQEFRDMKLNEPMSYDECVKAFTMKG